MLIQRQKLEDEATRRATSLSALTESEQVLKYERGNLELIDSKRSEIDDELIAPEVVLARRTAAGLPEPLLLAAEKYRLLCTRILQVARTLRSKVFMVTSSISEEGKTLTSLNLAFGLSHVQDKRTLLVELDLRRPSMHRQLGIQASAMDITFLERSDDWHSSLWKLRPNLHALLAVNGSLRPDELLQSEKITRFMEQARGEYDFVVIDTAPLLVAADAHALLPLVDHALFVVRANHTPIECARDALAMLGKKALGCVLNDVSELKYEQYYSRYYIGGTNDD
jgi:capsular exopolysaccharide synthesis family protein